MFCILDYPHYSNRWNSQKEEVFADFRKMGAAMEFAANALKSSYLDTRGADTDHACLVTNQHVIIFKNISGSLHVHTRCRISPDCRYKVAKMRVSR